ncbi:unnamed protein product [Pneumocystis jirovecii]|uniref:Transcription factor Iwr1 domain-containing protein n=2 Tax=Pneumocystis jirovecii TaxID=42068 RepID=L0P932_PNEJI|nr:uncharacterized protein T551_02549 [Pneumocystis jirovecii RU7]KTW28699.1 hypothetical protein T551_02549 [Pneumocystis jirovecii RU7]CCJ28145.1 unnamed protein product [Pneumocystis jirovecii]CCJ30502.1 unnamed protein product [Pneumocystis jirovecii]
MLQIKRKHNEEPIPLLFMAESSDPSGSISPFKRKKKENDYVFILSETVQNESIKEYLQKQEGKQITKAKKQSEWPPVYTLEKILSNELKNPTNCYEISPNKNRKSLESDQPSPMNNYVYDMYVPLVYTPDEPLPTSQYGVLMVKENENISFFEDTLNSSEEDENSEEDEDSNAEDFYRNTYPDEDTWPTSDTEEYESKSSLY